MSLNTALSENISNAYSEFSQAKGPVLDQKQLKSELLSLGHPKLTPLVAELLSKAIMEEVAQRPRADVSAELISELVIEKLQDLGFWKASVKQSAHSSLWAEEEVGGLSEGLDEVTEIEFLDRLNYSEEETVRVKVSRLLM